MIVPIILSGGSGTRLWPLSRELYPKQFLSLVNHQSLLQSTLGRLDGLADLAAPVVICNDEHRFLVAEQMREMGIKAAATILEPCGRNTAPAIAVAAMQVVEQAEDALLLVLPSDHVIADIPAFHAAVQQAVAQAEMGYLTTFGVVPMVAETGYGYIQAGQPLGDGAAREVSRFVEKPDAETAEYYVQSGEYFWNSGMFLFSAAEILAEIELRAPQIAAACRQAWERSRSDLDFVRLDADAFEACPSDSIDYAVMERTSRAAVVPLSAGWSDIGSWSALWEISERSESGNATHGEVIAQRTHNCLLHSDGRLVAAIGVQDLIVVETADAVLVAHKEHVQDVKVLVNELKSRGSSTARAHRKVYRPWGSYDSVVHGDRFQVKQITVNPGASLSLQMHHHRAEHWVVVKGTAKISCNGDTVLLSENQSTYIPIGTTHRLENPGRIPLELIEVQSGSYLGEDDIVRLEDKYGRMGTS